MEDFCALTGMATDDPHHASVSNILLLAQTSFPSPANRLVNVAVIYTPQFHVGALQLSVIR